VIAETVAARIDRFYRENGEATGRVPPLAGKGAVFVREAGDDELARLMAAIGWCESNGGLEGPGARAHNPFGLMLPGGGLREFPSWDQAIRYLARLLEGPLYAGAGLDTIEEIGSRYCPVGAANDPAGKNALWVPCVTARYTELGGSRYLGRRAPVKRPLRLMDGRMTVLQGRHPTAGLPGFPANDFGAPGGTLVRAPFDGRVPPLSDRPFGRLPRQEPALGFGGARVYLVETATGKESYLAHFGLGTLDLLVRPGQHVEAGQPLGRVWDWPGQPGRSHIHWGSEAGEPLGLYVNAAGTLLKAGAPPHEAELEMPFLRKVGKVDCVGRGFDTPGRWQVLRLLPDGRTRLIGQGSYKEARAMLEEKRAWVERQIARPA
jgi:hypothetical protein